MANHASHAALPYPIKGARFTLLLPYLDADGDPTAPTTPDTEISEDNAAATDCAEEASATSGMDGMAMLTLSGAETDCSILALNAKVASGPKATLAMLSPRALASVGTGTLSAGSAGGGTLGTILAYDVTGCFIKTTGGTGGGGTGGANNQARRIITYVTSTGAFTVEPNWETAPDNTTTYTILLPEGVTLGMLRALNPATPGRTAVVDANGLIDANTVKVGPSGSGTAQTAGDIPARLPAALGANGNIKADVRDYNGTAGTFSSGRPEVNTTHLAGTAYATAAAALVQAVWDAATSALTTVGSIGKKLADWVVGTIDTYTGNTKQTGDAFARIGAAGAGLTALGDSRIANLDATVSSRGTGTALTAADVRTALGLASANLDTQLDALPTNAELATALAAADDAVLAAIAALNNLSAAQVNAEVVDALRTDTGTEVSSVPAAAAPISAQVQFMYQALRNKVLSGASLRIHNDAGTVVATKTQSDDGTTYTEAKAT